MSRPPILNENDYEKIKSKSFMGMIDKRLVENEFNISTKTTERILKKIGLSHASRQTIDIIKQYLDGKSTKDLAEEYHMSTVNVVNLIKFRNIPRRYCHYFFDFNFFEKIDTEEKAYFLGFIYADGCIYKNTLKISISSKDIDILEKFKTCINSNHPIRETFPSTNFGNKTSMISLELTHKKLCDDLKKFGVVPNKTFKIIFPENLDPKLYNHFIRGYIDGDGSFGKYLSNDGYKRSSLSIVGTESFLLKIKEIFIAYNFKVCKNFYNRWPDKKTNIRSLQVSGNENMLNLLKWIYKDSTIFLERKHKVFLSLLE